MDQIVQLIGAVIVLAAFVANQRHLLSSDSRLFLAMNAVGTGILAVIAGIEGDLGFVLLEGVWAVVSVVSLTRALRADQTVEAG